MQLKTLQTESKKRCISASQTVYYWCFTCEITDSLQFTSPCKITHDLCSMHLSYSLTHSLAHLSAASILSSLDFITHQLISPCNLPQSHDYHAVVLPSHMIVMLLSFYVKNFYLSTSSPTRNSIFIFYLKVDLIVAILNSHISIMPQ